MKVSRLTRTIITSLKEIRWKRNKKRVKVLLLIRWNSAKRFDCCESCFAVNAFKEADDEFLFLNIIFRV